MSLDDEVSLCIEVEGLNSLVEFCCLSGAERSSKMDAMPAIGVGKRDLLQSEFLGSLNRHQVCHANNGGRSDQGYCGGDEVPASDEHCGIIA